jgi:hypothetical protein
MAGEKPESVRSGKIPEKAFFFRRNGKTPVRVEE